MRINAVNDIRSSKNYKSWHDNCHVEILMLYSQDFAIFDMLLAVNTLVSRPHWSRDLNIRAIAMMIVNCGRMKIQQTVGRTCKRMISWCFLTSFLFITFSTIFLASVKMTVSVLIVANVSRQFAARAWWLACTLLQYCIKLVNTVSQEKGVTYWPLVKRHGIQYSFSLVWTCAVSKKSFHLLTVCNFVKS